MNIKLLGDRILVEVDKEEKKTSSGLIITESKEMDSFHIGTVAVVGEGKILENPGDSPIPERYPMSVEIGDKVIFQFGKPIQVEGKQYLLVTESDIIMVI